MNYHCPADLPPEKDLTVDAVKLFQRFRQEADVARVETLLDAEFNRHLRLCELAITHAAASSIYWAELPRHPLQAVDVAVARHLEEMGFKIEFRHVAREVELPKAHNEKERVRAMAIESAYFAKWFLVPSLDEAASAAEWRRREALEGEDLKKNPPERMSIGSGSDFQSGPTAWAAMLDQKYVVEVQRLYGRNYLCLFDLDGKLRHAEETNVAYGAMFGPDCGDVAMWEERAQQIVDGWGAGQPPA